MFRKENHSAELRSDLPDEAGVFCEPADVAFVAAIHEDRAEASGARPMIEVDEVALAEGGSIGEGEVIETLCEVAGLIGVVADLLPQIVLVGAGEFSDEAGD